MTSEESLRRAADLFYEIGGSVSAAKLLENPRNVDHVVMGPKLREGLRTPEQLQQIAANGFELCVRALQALGTTDVMIHECGKRDLEPWEPDDGQ